MVFYLCGFFSFVFFVEFSVPLQPGSAPQENIGLGGTCIYLVSDPVEYSVPVQPGSAPQENIGFGGTTET
jgi:hypothetical protein